MEHIIYLSFAQSQGVDGALLKKNVSAVMVRAGQGTWEDPLFQQHYQTVVDQKIPFGVWWFLQPNMDASLQVDEFLKIYERLPIKPRVIALDVEEIDYFEGGVLKKVFPPSRIYSHDNTLRWLRSVQAATGGKVGIYTRKFYFEEWTIETPEWAKFWLWIAAWYNYTGQVPPDLPWGWQDYKIHQYEGGTGRIDGVTGPVCREYFNGTHDELLAFFEPPWTEAPAPTTPTDIEKLEARIMALENWARSFSR